MMRRKRVYNIPALLTYMVLLLLFGFPTFAVQASVSSEQRVFDQAGLLEEEQIGQLELEIETVQQEIGMDVVVVTTADAGGRTAREYADQFYIDGNFGTGKDYSGVLFLIDMDNREIYVNAVGTMVRFLTDDRREVILDAAYPSMIQQDYQGAIQNFLGKSLEYVREGIESGQYNIDEETGAISIYRTLTPMEILTALTIAGLIAVIPCWNIKRTYAMKRNRQVARGTNRAYIADAGFAYHQKSDQCINTRVLQRHIPKPPSGGSRGAGGSGGRSSSGRSTTHRSSGRTFSGSGRKF